MAMIQPIATRRSVTGIPTGKLAVWWLVGSEIVIFGGLVITYIINRLLHESWADEAANTSLLAGSVNTFILLTSSLFAVLSHNAAESKDGKKAAFYMWLTVLGALMFVGVKSVEWTMEITHGFVMTKSLFWSFYYTVAGLHALHVIGGAIIMGIIAIDLRKGKNLHRAELIGIYWHFVDIVWIFLFPLLYIAK